MIRHIVMWRLAGESYAVHPEHLRVRQELGTLRTSRHQVDYQYS